MLDKTLIFGIGLGLGLAAGLAFDALPTARGGELSSRTESRLDKRTARAVKAADRKGVVSGGVAAALVVDVADPDGLGRVRVRFPWDDAKEPASGWARVVSMVDSNGYFFRPEIDDEVIVAFVHGDIRQPIVLGSVWNAEDGPPPRPGTK